MPTLFDVSCFLANGSVEVDGNHGHHIPRFYTNGFKFFGICLATSLQWNNNNYECTKPEIRVQEAEALVTPVTF